MVAFITLFTFADCNLKKWYLKVTEESRKFALKPKNNLKLLLKKQKKQKANSTT